MGKLVDLTGQVFNRLTVLRKSADVTPVGAKWDCLCACGNLTTVNSLKLRKGRTKSCGCHRAVVGTNLNRSHGMANKSLTYRSWKEMRNRCNNPNSDNWPWYGGKGIKVCSRWDDFTLFLADLGHRPEGTTIDRIDNEGDYEPGNCRWLPQVEQTRRQAKNRLNDALAEALRKDRESGLTYRALGALYGVSPTTAHRCCSGITWS